MANKRKKQQTFPRQRQQPVRQQPHQPQTETRGGNSLTLSKTDINIHQVMQPPPSEELARLEALIPGAAERAFRIWERQHENALSQSVHRMGLEKRVISSDVVKSYIGLVAGFGYLYGCIFYSNGLGMAGHDTVATAMIGSGVLGAASSLIYAVNTRKRERQENRKNVKEK